MKSFSLLHILLLVVGFLAEESWRESKNMHDDIVTIKTSLPYMQADISTLKKNCVDQNELQLAIQTQIRQNQRQVNILPTLHNQE